MSDNRKAGPPPGSQLRTLGADEVQNLVEASSEAAADCRARFLEAWKRGVVIAGAQYFNVTAPSIAEAIDKNQLRPNYQAVADMIGVISRGEGAFLAAMYSFFNSEDGQKFLERAGFPNICDLAAKLDPDRAEVIAELFLNYRGW